MKTHFKNRLFLFINFCLLLILVACKDPASTKTIDDPKRLRPIISLTRSLNNESGVVNSDIKVTLKDMNNESIEIDNGKITINGHTMREPGGTFFWEFRDYYDSTFPLGPDSLYTFKIYFSDGDFYEAWIITPDIKLNQMDVPLKHRRKTDLSIKWSESDYRYPQTLLIQYYQPSDGFSSESQNKIALRYPYLGSFTINKDYIKYTDKASEVIRETRIQLVAETTGALDQQFQPGGIITCKFNLYQDIEIY